MSDLPALDPRCRHGRLCTDTAVVVDETGGTHRAAAPVPTAGGLCPACARAAWWAVHDAPARVARLGEQVADPLRKPASNVDPTMPRGTQTERPCELDLEADALVRAIVHELSVWAAWIANDWAALDPTAIPEARARRAATVLHARWDDLLAADPATYRAHGTRPLAPDTLDPDGTGAPWYLDDDGLVVTRDGASAACAFLALDHRAAVKLGLGPARATRQREACPHCGAPGSVVRAEPLHPGAPAPLRCEQCHRGITEDHFDVWAQLDTIATNPDAATRYVAPTPTTAAQRDEAATVAA